MKKIQFLFFTIFFGAVVLLNIGYSESRNVNITLPDGHHVEFSIGQIMMHSTLIGKPAGGWTLIPYSIKSPSSIIGSGNFGPIKSFTMTESFALTSDINKVRFDMVVSTNDTTISTSPYTTAASANVELVDASTNAVLATLFTENNMSDANWTEGMGNGPAEMDNVAPVYVGHTVYLRLNVQWDTTAGSATFDATATTGSDALTYVDLRAPFAPPGGFGKSANAGIVVANSMNLSNTPNPVSDFTTIHIENASAPVSLKVYDMIGREVADLSSALINGNTANISINTSALLSGSYVYRLVTETGTVQRRMIVRH